MQPRACLADLPGFGFRVMGPFQDPNIKTQLLLLQGGRHWRPTRGGLIQKPSSGEVTGLSLRTSRLGSPVKPGCWNQRLVYKIPHVSDLQSAWLLLLLCAASRPNYILRVVHPEATREFATLHGTSMLRCVAVWASGAQSEEEPQRIGRVGQMGCT